MEWWYTVERESQWNTVQNKILKFSFSIFTNLLFLHLRMGWAAIRWRGYSHERGWVKVRLYLLTYHHLSVRFKITGYCGKLGLHEDLRCIHAYTTHTHTYSWCLFQGRCQFGVPFYNYKGLSGTDSSLLNCLLLLVTLMVLLHMTGCTGSTTERLSLSEVEGFTTLYKCSFKVDWSGTQCWGVFWSLSWLERR